MTLRLLTMVRVLLQALAYEDCGGQGAQLCVPRRLDKRHARCLLQVHQPHKGLLCHRVHVQTLAIVDSPRHPSHLVVGSYRCLYLVHSIGRGKGDHKSKLQKTTASLTARRLFKFAV
jgi:hypothetical protein